MKNNTNTQRQLAMKSLVLAMAGAGLLSLPQHVLANPTGGQVVAGNVTIRQESATKVGITQTTDKGIIDWQKFSIGAKEHVQFYQPSASSVTLNRVVGQDPSQILGRLSANGQIFLINPNGIFFGKNAQIDVAGLVASTHNIRNEDFLAGRYNFNIPGKPGAAVINEGNIRIADTGIAAFVAPSVANRGVIVARLGKVALAAANGFTLDFHGDQLLSFLVSDDVAKTAFDLEGQQLTSFVENSGRIEAQGGYVLLTAKAAENAIHGVINHSGVIEATTVGTQKGEIILHAGKGSLEVSGTLDASAPNGGDGGFVETSGAQLSFLPSQQITTLAASGNHGIWLIDPLDILVGTGGVSAAVLNSAQTNVILEATNNITFQAAVNIARAGVGITAKAGRDILVDANITTNNGEINLLAGFDNFTGTPGVNDGKVIINGARVNSGTAPRNIIGRAPSTDGLVGYWTLDGSAKDGSGNANNGTASANVTFVSDGTRQVAKFGGISRPGSIAVANNSSLTFTPNMSLSYWVRMDSTTGMNGFGGTASVGTLGTAVAKSHDRSGFYTGMSTDSSGKYWAGFGNNAYSSPRTGIGAYVGGNTADAIGQWTHIAYTFSVNESKLYINGTLASTVAGPVSFAAANNQNLYFGKFSDSWYPLNGALDEVRLYNRTLNSTQVAELYRGIPPLVIPPVTPVTSNLVTSASVVRPPEQKVIIASAVSYAVKNPLTEADQEKSGFRRIVGAVGRVLDKVEDFAEPFEIAYEVKDLGPTVLELADNLPEIQTKWKMAKYEVPEIADLLKSGQAEKSMKGIAKIINKMGGPDEAVKIFKDLSKFSEKSKAGQAKVVKKIGKIGDAIEIGGNLVSSLENALEIWNKFEIALDPNGGYNWGDSTDLTLSAVSLTVGALATKSVATTSVFGVSAAGAHSVSVTAAPYLAAALITANLTKMAAEYASNDTVDAAVARDIHNASVDYSSFLSDASRISNGLAMGKITRAQAEQDFLKSKAAALDGLAAIENNMSGFWLNTAFFLTGSSGDIERVENTIKSIRPVIENISFRDVLAAGEAKNMVFEAVLTEFERK